MVKKWKQKAAAKAKANPVAPPSPPKVEQTKSPVGAVTTGNAPGLVPPPTHPKP